MARPKADNPKSQPVSLRLTDAQREWLKAQEEETGNDASATIRFLLSQAMKGPVAPTFPTFANPPPDPHEEMRRQHELQEAARKEAERQAKIAAKRRELEALERGEDPDAIDDENPENYGEADPDPFDPFDEGTLAEAPSQPTPKGPAFSVTRPAGMRADLRGGAVVGDAKGNIIRENFKWLG